MLVRILSVGTPITLEEFEAKVVSIPDMVSHHAEKPSSFLFCSFLEIDFKDMEKFRKTLQAVINPDQINVLHSFCEDGGRI